MVTRRLVTPKSSAVEVYGPEDLQNVGLTIVDIAHDEELEPSQPGSAAAADHRLAWGSVLTVPYGVSAVGNYGASSGTLTTPYFKDDNGQIIERDCTVIISPVAGEAGNVKTGLGAGGNNQNIIICFINYQVGAVNIQKSFAIQGGGTRFVELTASQVTVWFALYKPLSSVVGGLDLNVAVVPGHHKAGNFFGWNVANDDGHAANLLVTGPGTLAWLSATMTAAGPATPTAPLYLLGFDKLTAPLASATPIPGFVSLPLTGQFSVATFSDDVTPQSISWGSGLYYVLSTTPGSYTAPSAGATLNLQMKYGS